MQELLKMLNLTEISPKCIPTGLQPQEHSQSGQCTTQCYASQCDTRCYVTRARK